MARGRASDTANGQGTDGGAGGGERKGKGAGKQGGSSSGSAASARKQRNRESALRSRQRKQQVIAETREKIVDMATKKETLQTRLALLRAQNDALKAECAARAEIEAGAAEAAPPMGAGEPLVPNITPTAPDALVGLNGEDAPVDGAPILTDLLDGLLDPVLTTDGSEPTPQ